MLISLRVENYKSLKSVSLRLQPFMVLVGANAAGKTNFVDCLDFLGRCFRDGLSDAVGAKGGYENIAFRRARRARAAIAFQIKCRFENQHSGLDSLGYGEISFDYRFAFGTRKQAIAAEYTIVDETIDIRWKHKEFPGSISIDRRSKKTRFSYTKDPPGFLPRKYIEAIVNEDIASDELFVSRRLPIPPMSLATQFLSEIGVYRVSAEAVRRPGDPSGRKQLGNTGENLPAALQHMSKNDKQAAAELVAHLQRASSAFTGIETDYVETKQLGLFVKEQGVGRRWYAKDLSDGTLQTIAIFVPLLDKRLPLVAIEEPENSLHPWVIKDFIETCRKQVGPKQIILTTHSPVLVSHLRPKELFLVDRQSGATSVCSAVDVDRNVEDIIRNGDMDLGSYWNSGQMSAVPGGKSLWELLDNGENGDS